ncbi:hypothetical protein Vadar_011251 [Vaccinium darrowii]|uniref:Uncharacterized protein n=1 Tax=Vaccinium darrowii TaxID=229202 RepID=A0ACB7XY86_9ERIC|nr:hypothetical protein Vadar_011251 [Vaccinium darrowii]
MKLSTFYSWSIGKLRSTQMWSISVECNRGKKNGSGGGSTTGEENGAGKKNSGGGGTTGEENGAGKENSGSCGTTSEENGAGVIVLKVDRYNCNACEKKLKRRIQSMDGVLWVERNNEDPNQLTVIGTVDPEKLREKLEKKIKKKVELVSPQPKKDREIPVTTSVMKVNLDSEQCLPEIWKAVWDTNGFREMTIVREKNQLTVKGAIDMEALAESLRAKLKRPVVIAPPENGEEIPVTTAVMKVNLDSEQCLPEIWKAVWDTKGLHEMTIVRDENQLTVTGAIDMKALAESLRAKLQEPVVLVLPENGGGGSEGGAQGYSNQYGPHGPHGYVNGYTNQYGPHGPYGYVNGYRRGYPGEQLHAPQMFSDENPNACAIM